MITLSSTATIGDFLAAASKRMPGVSMKIDDCRIPVQQDLYSYADGVLVISQIPYESVLLPARAPTSAPTSSSAASFPPQLLDLAFIMDATGSMARAIKGVHDLAFQMGRAFRIDRKLQLQLACICDRDPIDSPGDVHAKHDFNVNVMALQQFLEGVEATGGGDRPEDFVGAIDAISSIQ
jgi:hypothetical protein